MTERAKRKSGAQYRAERKAREAERVAAGLPPQPSRPIEYPPLPDVGELNTVADWRRELGNVYRGLRRGQIPAEIVSRLAYVASVAMKLCEAEPTTARPLAVSGSITDAAAASAIYQRLMAGATVDFARLRFAPPEKTASPAVDPEVLAATLQAPEPAAALVEPAERSAPNVVAFKAPERRADVTQAGPIEGELLPPRGAP